MKEARGLRRMKTETDKEIVASNDARRRLMLRTMKEVRVKMGIKERTLDADFRHETSHCQALSQETIT